MGTKVIHISMLHPHNSDSPFGMLSVIIITKNESRNIRRCLESVSWADEIIVVDSGSEDDTLSICRQFDCRIEGSDWSGFGPQKNKALKLATSEWVLSIDADEEVSPALRREIEAVINDNDSNTAWRIRRKSSYCGKVLNYSGWNPDFVLRLFKRRAGRFSDDLVHERVLIDQENTLISQLDAPLFHYPMPGFEQAIEKMNLYSTLSAQDKFRKGEKSSLLKAVSRGCWTFFRVFVLYRGFLDGRHGFMLAISNAGGTYYKYVKLAHLHDSANKNDAI